MKWGTTYKSKSLTAVNRNPVHLYRFEKGKNIEWVEDMYSVLTDTLTCGTGIVSVGKKLALCIPKGLAEDKSLSLISSSITDDGDGEAKSSKVANPDKPNWVHPHPLRKDSWSKKWVTNADNEKAGLFYTHVYKKTDNWVPLHSMKKTYPENDLLVRTVSKSLAFLWWPRQSRSVSSRSAHFFSLSSLKWWA